MSWTFLKSGTIEEVVRAIEEHSNTIDGQSKEEYDEALPHLKALVSQNVGGRIELSANGHGIQNANKTWAEKSCQVSIRRI